MKINTIIHDKPKERKNDIHKNSYNKDPKYHPFMQEREYVRALNATKIDRLLAKPFVKAYNYHVEGISHLTQNKNTDIFASASFDSSIYIWNVKEDLKYKIQKNCKITGLSFIGDNLIVGENNRVVLYEGEWSDRKRTGEINEYEVKHVNNVNSHKNEIIISTSNGVKVFDLERKTQKYSIGNSFCNYAEANTVLDNLLAFSENNTLNLVDTRANEIFSRVKVGIRSNEIKFNIDGKYMASGNEDSFLYLHDLRYLNNPFCVFKHHFNAINCIDFGKKLVSGSADTTVRIFDVQERKCLDVYHTRRMFRVNGIKLSKNEEFVISGSDDGNLRLWKTNASRKIGIISDNQNRALAYNDALKDKFKYVKEIHRISNQRFLPKPLKSELKVRKEQIQAQKRREERKKEK